MISRTFMRRQYHVAVAASPPIHCDVHHCIARGAPVATRRESLASDRSSVRWARMHHQALLEDWELCANKQTPNRIPPLP